MRVKIPLEWASKERVEFQWDADSEAMVYDEQGKILQGLTGGGGDNRRVQWILPDEWRDGKWHLFYIEASMNEIFGCGGGDIIQPPDQNRFFLLKTADIVVPNMEAERLFIDFWIIGDCARELPSNDWKSYRALEIGNQIINAFKRGDTSSLVECRKIAKDFLGSAFESADVYANDKDVLVYAVGNCHIDTAWLWPFDETKRKVARSWSTQLDLMNRYPEHRFVGSQAQQFKWLHMYYPELYNRVKERIDSGEFLAIGGTWVEMDTNMPSGESLARQFLYGQRYFEEYLGKRCEVFWLPDTFGYSAQMPQLSRLAGMKYFFTQKLSWNNINNFPYTTFNWVGLDGTQVMTHMAPSETYTAQAHTGDVIRSVTQHKSLREDRTSLLMFGNGDGGGGPQARMLEKLRRLRGAADTVDAVPRVKMGGTVEEFFYNLEKNSNGGSKLSSWYGELYFELHRGTYTSQARTKYHNRRSEVLLNEIEFYSTIASIYTEYKYPKSQIDSMYEDVLLCQFHDVLPGSAIEMVYDDADKMYERVLEKGDALLSAAIEALGAKRIKPEPGSYKYVNDDKCRLVSLKRPQFEGQEVVRLTNNTGNQSQISNDGVLCLIDKFSELEIVPTSLKLMGDSQFIMENGNIKATFNGGHLLSLYDKANKREVISKGSIGNRLIMYDDQPLYWDAWDVEIYHLEKPEYLEEGKITVLEDGPLMVSVLVENKLGASSWIKRKISLAATSSLSSSKNNYIPGEIVVDCEVEWHESRRFLKVEFPVSVQCDTASYECQFGIVKRPTHFNTTWDKARFEVVCQKWADLSENGYGISILNDSKHGFATQGSTMRLSLLRSPKAPDGNADMGNHHFKYAIVPHKGSVYDAGIAQLARKFNHPTLVVEDMNTEKLLSAIKAIELKEGTSIIMDTIKRAEDDTDVVVGKKLHPRVGKSIIIRLYEAYGGHATDILSTTLKVKQAFASNILEDDIEVLPIEYTNFGTTEISLSLKPFQVYTLRFQL